MAYQPTVPDLLNTIRELEKRVRILENANRLTSSSVGSGGIDVKDGGAIRIYAPDGSVLVTLDSSGLTASGGTISGATVEGGVIRTDVSPNNRVEIRKETGFENGGIFLYDDGSAGGTNIGRHRIYATPDTLNIMFGDAEFPNIQLTRSGQIFMNGSDVTPP